MARSRTDQRPEGLRDENQDSDSQRNDEAKRRESDDSLSDDQAKRQIAGQTAKSGTDSNEEPKVPAKKRGKNKHRAKRIMSCSDSESEAKERYYRIPKLPKSSRNQKRKREASSSSEDDFERVDMFDPDENNNSVKLQPHMGKFLAKYFHKYLEDSKMKQVLEDIPLPENPGLSVPKMDEEWAELMKENNADYILKNDKNLARIQMSLMRAMAPVCLLWTEMDSRKRQTCDNPFSNEEVVQLFEKVIISLGQTNVAINYFRRLPALSKMTGSTKKAHKLLTKNGDILDGEKELFGEEFDKAINESAKKRKESRELKKSFGDFRRSRRPFRGSPAGAQTSSRGRYTSRYQTGNGYQNRGQSQPHRQDRGGHSRGGYRQQSVRGRYDTAVKFIWTRGIRLPCSSQGESNQFDKQEFLAKYDCGTFSTKGKTRDTRETESQTGKGKERNNRVECAVQCSKAKTTGNGTRISRPVKRQRVTSRGQTQTFPVKLGKGNQGQGHTRNSYGDENRMGSEARTTRKTVLSEVQRSRKPYSRSESTEVIEERSNTTSNSDRRSSDKSHISNTKKEWRSSTSIQSEEGKPEHSVPTLQNGKFEGCTRSDSARRLHGEGGSEGCILQHTNSGGRKKIPSVHVGKETLRVPSHGVRIGSGTEGVYQGTKTDSSAIEKDGVTVSNLSGRSDYTESGSRSVNERSENSSVPHRELGISDKLGENGASSNPDHRISRDDVEYKGDGDLSTKRENEGYYSGMQILAQAAESLCPIISANSRKVDSVDTSGLAGTVTLQTSTNGQCEGIDEHSKLRDRGGSRLGMSRRSKLVDHKFRDEQWEVIDNSETGNPHNYGREQQRLGSMERRSSNKWPLDGRRAENAYKCEGTSSWDDGNKGVYKGIVRYPGNTAYGQCNSSCTSQQEGKSIIGEVAKVDNGTVAILCREEAYVDGDISAGREEYDGGFIIEELVGDEQLEIENLVLQTNRGEDGENHHRPLCRQDKLSENQICQLETRPICSEDRRATNSVERRNALCFSAVLPDRESAKKAKKRTSRHDSDHTYMAKPAVVSNDTRDEFRESDSVASNEGLINEPRRKDTSTNRTKRAHPGGMESERKRVSSQGFSEEATRLLTNRLRKGTQASYEYSWSKWCCWAGDREINIFRATVEDIVNFLSDMSVAGHEYSTINGFRSSLSQFHPHIDGFPVGQHPDVVKVMGGIFNEKPPKPKYSEFWDVGEVLDEVRLWGENETLQPRELTWKLALLIALTTAGRSSDLALLTTQYMVMETDSAVFYIAGLPKTRKPGKKQPSVEVFGLPEDPILDPLQCLKTYLERTNHLRPSEGNNLFVSISRPYKPIVSSTIAGWIKKLLAKVGVDTEIWTAHSTRGAATSKALSVGVSVKTILDSANWSSAGTFKRFYNRPISSEKQDFQKKVLL